MVVNPWWCLGIITILQPGRSLPPGWPSQHRPERVGGLAHDPAAVVVGEPGQGCLAESHLAEVPTYTGRGEVGTPHDASWREGRNHASEELLLGWGQIGIRAETGAGHTQIGIGQLGQAFQSYRHRGLVLGAIPSGEVVRGKENVRVAGSHVPHPVHLLRLAAATEGDRDAE